MEIYPTGIEVSNGDQQLEISWSDNQKSIYPLRGLRLNCPCVICRGGHANMGDFDPSAFFEEDPEHIHIRNINTIGNHAIQIVWSDGHDSGMYRWETLRFLDPENHRAEFEK